MRNSKVIEGYLYIYPYAGDDIFVHPEKISTKSLSELSRIHEEAWEGKGVSLLEVISRFEGRKVRVVINDKRVLVEVLE